MENNKKKILATVLSIFVIVAVVIEAAKMLKSPKTL